MALLDEVLDQTKQAAVQEAAQIAVQTVAGPDVLTTPEVLARLEQYQAATQAIIGQQAQQITDLLGQTANLLQQLAGKASADSLASVRQRVTTAEATLATTATTAYVSQQLQAIADLDASQTQALAGLQAALASDAGMLQGILSKQANYDLLLPALRTDVDAKATAATVSSLTGRVTTLSNTVNDTTTGLATRAAGTDLAALTTTVAGKALASDVGALTATVSGKANTADLQALTTTVAGKALAADLTATNSALSALAATVGGKALASDLATTNSNVAANTVAIGLRATMAALTTQTSRIDGLVNTTVPALQADTALRLLRTGDVATGSLMVPQAVTGPAAPRFDQTYGGLNSPIRAAYGFGSTSVQLGPGPLTDPTPQGRKAQVIQVFMTMKTAPTVGLNVTIKVGTTPGGAEVFTKTYLLTALPGLNALLAAVPTSIAELPAGTVLYAQAVNNLGTDGGKWDAIVQSYYKS